MVAGKAWAPALIEHVVEEVQPLPSPIKPGEAIRIRAVGSAEASRLQRDFRGGDEPISTEMRAYLGRTGTCDGVTESGGIIFMEIIWAPKLVERAGEFVNDEGAPMHFGTNNDGRVYCNRSLGVFNIPGSLDGRCGPDVFPQCSSCLRWTRGSADHAKLLGHEGGL